MLRSRGKVHEIIHHALQEDTDIEWSVIKRNSQTTTDPPEVQLRQV